MGHRPPRSRAGLALALPHPAGAVAMRRGRVIRGQSWPDGHPARHRPGLHGHGRFAASILGNERPSRWLALSVLSGGLLLLGGILGGGVWALLRQGRLWRVLARQPRPVAAELLGTRLVSNPGWAREYRFRYALNGTTRMGRQRLRVLKGSRGVPPDRWRYEEPIPLVPNGTRLLALAGALLVQASYTPLVLTETEKAGITAAQAAAPSR